MVSEWVNIKPRSVRDIRALAEQWGDGLRERLATSRKFRGMIDDPNDLLQGILDGSIDEATPKHLNWLRKVLKLEKNPEKNEQDKKENPILASDQQADTSSVDESPASKKSIRRKFNGNRINLLEPYSGTKSRIDVLREAIRTRDVRVADFFNLLAQKPDGFAEHTLRNWLSGSSTSAEPSHWNAIEALIRPTSAETKVEPS